MTLDDLIDDLATTTAQPAERGEFTLDPELARAKMREFQLDDPHRYVLGLVRTGVILGASAIAIEVGWRRLSVALGGVGFTFADLENLFAAVFGKPSGPRDRARRELALAINAALALSPARVTVYSATETGAVELTARLATPLEVEVVERRVSGTRIVVERVEPDRADALVRSHCRFSPVPVEVNNRVISHGPSLVDIVARQALDLEGAAGEVGFAPSDGEASRLMIVRDGVLITTHQLPRPREGLLAVVADPQLREDLSGADVVRDARYEALTEAVEQARAASLAWLARGLGNREWEADPLRRAETIVRDALADYRHPDEVVGPAATPLATKLRGAPAWRRVDEVVLTLGEIAERVVEDGLNLHYTTAAVDSDRPLLLLDRPEDVRLLTTLFGADKLEEVDASGRPVGEAGWPAWVNFLLLLLLATLCAAAFMWYAI